MIWVAVFFPSLFFSNFNLFLPKKIPQLKTKKSCIYNFATLPEIVLWYPEIHEDLLNTFAITSYNEMLLLLLSHFSRVRFCATPSLGFSRQEHWSGLPFPSPMHKSEKWKWSRSVMSNSSQPHGLQPTRLLCPWDFPGKSTGVGCHCLLCIMK